MKLFLLLAYYLLRGSVREEPVLLNLIKEITKHQAPLGLMKKTQLQMVIIVVPGLGLLVFDLDK